MLHLRSTPFCLCSIRAFRAVNHGCLSQSIDCLTAALAARITKLRSAQLVNFRRETGSKVGRWRSLLQSSWQTDIELSASGCSTTRARMPLALTYHHMQHPVVTSDPLSKGPKGTSCHTQVVPSCPAGRSRLCSPAKSSHRASTLDAHSTRSCRANHCQGSKLKVPLSLVGSCRFIVSK